MVGVVEKCHVLNDPTLPIAGSRVTRLLEELSEAETPNAFSEMLSNEREPAGLENAANQSTYREDDEPVQNFKCGVVDQLRTR